MAARIWNGLKIIAFQIVSSAVAITLVMFVVAGLLRIVNYTESYAEETVKNQESYEFIQSAVHNAQFFKHPSGFCVGMIDRSDLGVSFFEVDCKKVGFE